MAGTKPELRQGGPTILMHRHGIRTPFVCFEGIGNSTTVCGKESSDKERVCEPHVSPGSLVESGREQMRALGTFLAIRHKRCVLPESGAADCTAYQQSARLGVLEASTTLTGAAARDANIRLQVYSSSVSRCVECAKILCKAFVEKDVNILCLKRDYHSLYLDMISSNIEAMMSAPFKSDYGETSGDYINYLCSQARVSHKEASQRYQILDALLISSNQGYALPPYADKELLTQCLRLVNQKLVQGFTRILASELSATMMQHMEEYTADSENSPNFIIFSVSDIHIVSLFEIIGIPLEDWPDFGCAFEIRIDSAQWAVIDRFNVSVGALVSQKKEYMRIGLDQFKACLAEVIA